MLDWYLTDMTWIMGSTAPIQTFRGIFSLLIEDILVYKEKCSVIINVDFNARYCTFPDFTENDMMGTDVNNFILNVIDHKCDIPMSTRESQDLVVNSFGRILVGLYTSILLPYFGDKKRQIHIFNHFDASVNDFY